ncbi:MAG TPA: porin [Gemmataceae bacterium]|nr:porin [Gemmataceae bacterium]
MGMTIKWESAGANGYGLWAKTPNGDFSMHPGFWMQYDNVFWTQTPIMRAPQGGNAGLVQGPKNNATKLMSGDRLGGIGDMEDGTFFRRIRPFIEGTLWDTFEYRFILALENDQFSTSGLDEFWIGMNNIPVIGTIRAGHVKTPMGLEADMTASSRTMTFLERSSYSEAIELNQNFVTGLWFGNAFLDQRTTYQFAVFRPDQGASSGTFFGDGQWGYQGRLTGLPIWDADGRTFLHLGVSGGWRSGTNNLAVSSLRTIQLRAREEQRDDDPAGGPASSQTVPNANDARMIDTGALVADHCWLTGLEALWVLGPFSVQAEYGWNWVEDVRGVINPGAPAFPAKSAGSLITFKGAPQNYVFNGGYVQLSYILTGESRGYDKRIGTLSRDYFGGKGPFTNAWVTWDDDRRIFNWGWGAWELAARASYVDLNDGTGPQRVEGGIMHGFTGGLNWYLNNAVKLQFEYVYDQRSDVPTAPKPTLTNSTIPGFVGGLGMRVQVSF